MTAREFVSWSFDKKFDAMIAALVELGAKGLEEFQGRKNYKGTVAQKLLEERILAIVERLPGEQQLAFWRRVNPQQAVLVEKVLAAQYHEA